MYYVLSTYTYCLSGTKDLRELSLKECWSDKNLECSELKKCQQIQYPNGAEKWILIKKTTRKCFKIDLKMTNTWAGIVPGIHSFDQRADWKWFCADILEHTETV